MTGSTYVLTRRPTNLTLLAHESLQRLRHTRQTRYGWVMQKGNALCCLHPDLASSDCLTLASMAVCIGVWGGPAAGRGFLRRLGVEEVC